VSGGEWTQSGPAWTNTVFAYNLSLACNHCIHPKCAGVCPVDAYHLRPDGIVILDASQCIGCGYCAWACPYGAPQLDRSAGTMGKCDFCADNIDAGLPPACVAACPMRALDFSEASTARDMPASLALWETSGSNHPFPLPNYSRTQPHLAIQPHAGMSLPIEKSIANLEEVKPQRRSGWEEAPLVLFTLLMQAAVGSVWAISWMFTPLWSLIQYDAFRLRLAPLLIVGVCLGLGLAASFAHLGTKKNAWRVLGHLRKSWLSREVLLALLFGAGWLLAVWSTISWGYTPAVFSLVTGLLGLMFILSMARVYHLRAVPAWNTLRTEANFFLSALLLGILLMGAMLAFEAILTGIQLPNGIWRLIGISSLALLSLRSLLTRVPPAQLRVGRLWRGLTMIGMLAPIYFLVPGIIFGTGALVVFIIVLAEEGAARWLFYESRGG
jgi:anaerobic dimethyl sulfoxide reductase subunit B (iron-sulfur subunit)